VVLGVHRQNLRRGPVLEPPGYLRMTLAADTGDGFRKRDSLGYIREHKGTFGFKLDIQFQAFTDLSFSFMR
jgi:hypothetical protein